METLCAGTEQAQAGLVTDDQPLEDDAVDDDRGEGAGFPKAALEVALTVVDVDHRHGHMGGELPLLVAQKRTQVRLHIEQANR